MSAVTPREHATADRLYVRRRFGNALAIARFMLMQLARREGN